MNNASASATTRSAAAAPAFEPELSLTIAGLGFANPVWAASGTFGFGHDYADLIDCSRLGAICGKGLTLHARAGNRGARIHETPSGLLNSIGLENPGIQAFLERDLPGMAALGPRVVANLAGSTLGDYVDGARLLCGPRAERVDMIEINISCPNVEAGGMAFGLEPAQAARVIDAVRAVCDKPLVAKLSPNAPDIVAVARTCEDAGCDAISLVNTFTGMAIDRERCAPVFENTVAGLSGPAIRPLALRMVWDIAGAVELPVIGMGGIATWEDAVEFLMAGASAIQVGSATFARPDAMLGILDGLAAFMKTHGYESLGALVGKARPSPKTKGVAYA